MRIFYFAHSHNRPTGGQKQTYRHVDILNRHGFDACAWHTTPGFRLDWFENRTRTVDGDGFASLHDPDADIVVFPEDLGLEVFQVPGRKVVFNQNLFHGFEVLGRQAPRVYPYLHKDVRAVLAVSDHNRAALQFACPGLAVHRVVNGIDASRFAWTPLEKKRPLVACIAKSPAQLAVVFHLAQLRARQGLSRLDGFDWVFIEGRTERDVASILGDALAFVFLGVEEGLPLMPLEAMASGCLVLASGAGPLTEYLAPGSSFAVGDAVGLVTRLEEIASAFPRGLERFADQARAGRETAARFSLAEEERSVIAAWQSIVDAA